MKLISGSSNLPLAKNIAQQLNLPLVECEINRFPNGEKRVWIKEQLNGDNIILVQSLSHPVDELLTETLLLIDALERMGTNKVSLIIPWMGYSLQDKVFRPGEPIAAKVVANVLSNSYLRRIFLLDLHNNSIPGFFSIPTDHLTALEIFVQYCRDNFDLAQSVVASPDFGGLKRARLFANQLELNLVNIDKTRDLKTGEITTVNLRGNVKGKIALIFDDVIISGSTVVEVSKLLKRQGAKEVHFLATHGIFAQQSQKKLQKSTINSVVISNTVHHPHLEDKIKVIDIASLFTKTISHWV